MNDAVTGNLNERKLKNVGGKLLHRSEQVQTKVRGKDDGFPIMDLAPPRCPVHQDYAYSTVNYVIKHLHIIYIQQ